MVCGTQSGGTSLIAGMLHYLGVDMGSFPTTPGIRGYATYEDVSMKATYEDVSMKYYRLMPEPPEPYPVPIQQRFRLREYIKDRREKAGAQRFGAKMSSTYWLGFDLSELGIDVVLVNRPLEDSIQSDWRIWCERHKDCRPTTLAWQAASVAWSFAMKDILREMFPPVLELDFYETLTSPMDAVVDMSATLGLNPTRAQENAACEFADPEMRHI
jgi:hypothetical protein